MRPEEGETLGQFLHRFRPEADASDLGDTALVHRLRQCLPATTQTLVAMLKGGDAPEKIIDWYDALHIIDCGQVTSLAIRDASQPINPAVDVASNKPRQPDEKVDYMTEIASEVIRGVRATLTTSNRFSMLEPGTDSVAQSMNAMPQLSAESSVSNGELHHNGRASTFHSCALMWIV